MSPTGKVFGAGVAAVMFAFSAWMFLQTGDWVAAVFAAGSLGYGLFFISQGESK